jgi:hypothetical protein
MSVADAPPQVIIPVFKFATVRVAVALTATGAG